MRRNIFSEENFFAEEENFVARTLYCANCKVTVPVKEKLLLVLPDGELYEYVCPQCGDVLGDKKTSSNNKITLL